MHRAGYSVLFLLRLFSVAVSWKYFENWIPDSKAQRPLSSMKIDQWYIVFIVPYKILIILDSSLQSYPT